MSDPPPMNGRNLFESRGKYAFGARKAREGPELGVFISHSQLDRDKDEKLPAPCEHQESITTWMRRTKNSKSRMNMTSTLS